MATSRAALPTTQSMAIFAFCCLIAWSCLSLQLSEASERSDETAISQSSEDQDEMLKVRPYLSASEATAIQIHGATSEDLEDQNQPEAANGRSK